MLQTIRMLLPILTRIVNFCFANLNRELKPCSLFCSNRKLIKDTKIEGSQQTNSGSIPTKLLGQLLRFVGENPSDAEVQVKAFTSA